MDAELRRLARVLETSPDDVELRRSLVNGLERSGERLAALFVLYRVSVDGPLDGDAPVLVVGGPGTKKALLARAIHEASGREGPVKFAALARLAQDTSLRGYSFNGPSTGRREYAGVLERCSRGTVVVDADALNPESGATLVSVVREKTVRRVGDSQARPADVRLVLTTAHPDPTRCTQELLDLVKTRLELPSLGSRLADLPLFLERLGARDKALPTKKSWPRNDEELEAAIARLVET